MRGAIFDMDGLLIDSERLWQLEFHNIARERGIALPDSFPNEVCGTGGKRTREVLSRHFHTDDPEAVLRECSARVHKLEEHGVPLKPGVNVILRGLRDAGYRIAVASSSPMDMIRQNLRLDGIEDYFDILVTGREVPNGKPAPDIFLLAAERLGIPTEECWVFEDSLSGVEASWRAHCRVVMIPDIVQPTERVRGMCHGIYAGLAQAWEAIRSGR